MIAGTHVTVEVLLKELAAFGTVDALLTTHPELDRAAIHVALTFAADALPVLERTADPQPFPASEEFTPRTEFGKEMWALHQAVVEAAHRSGEPLLETWEDVQREVRERRGERDYFEEDL